MGSRLFLWIVAVTLLGAVVASAAMLNVDGGVLQVFAEDVDLAPEPADIKITPQTLNATSDNGQPSVTVQVRFPSGLSSHCQPGGNNSARMTVKGQSELSISAAAHPNNPNSWMVKFTRDEVLSILSGQTAGDVILVVTGVIDSCLFTGEDTIKYQLTGGGSGPPGGGEKDEEDEGEEGQEQEEDLLESESAGELVEGDVEEPETFETQDAQEISQVQVEDGQEPSKSESEGDEPREDAVDEGETPGADGPVEESRDGGGDDPVQEKSTSEPDDNDPPVDDPGSRVKQPVDELEEPEPVEDDNPEKQPLTPKTVDEPEIVEQEPEEVYPPLQPIQNVDLEKPEDRPGRTSPAVDEPVSEQPGDEPGDGGDQSEPDPLPETDSEENVSEEAEEELNCPIDAGVRFDPGQVDVGVDEGPVLIALRLPDDLPKTHGRHDVRSLVLRVKLGEDRYGDRTVEIGRSLTVPMPGVFELTHEQAVDLLEDHRGEVTLEASGVVDDCAFVGTGMLMVIETESEPEPVEPEGDEIKQVEESSETQNEEQTVEESQVNDVQDEIVDEPSGIEQENGEQDGAVEEQSEIDDVPEEVKDPDQPEDEDESAADET